jgi:hypothetical protein
MRGKMQRYKMPWIFKLSIYSHVYLQYFNDAYRLFNDALGTFTAT